MAPGRICLHVPEMRQAGADRRAYRLGVMAKLAVDTALAAGKPLAREDLSLVQLSRHRDNAIDADRAIMPMDVFGPVAGRPYQWLPGQAGWSRPV